jgi:hypothetical protein
MPHRSSDPPAAAAAGLAVYLVSPDSFDAPPYLDPTPRTSSAPRTINFPHKEYDLEASDNVVRR